VINNYLTSKYYEIIKNNDELDKICNESLLKHGYKVLKTGTGNYLTNPMRYAENA
jgi:hypothetical protein